MRHSIATAPAQAPAVRDHAERQDNDNPKATSSRRWALLEALAYAGAFIDPTGVLAVQRFRGYLEE